MTDAQSRFGRSQRSACSSDTPRRAGIILELVAADPRDAEILAVAVAEIEARHRRGRQHREILGQRHPAGIAAEHVEQDRLEAVVGAGRIARAPGGSRDISRGSAARSRNARRHSPTAGCGPRRGALRRSFRPAGRPAPSTGCRNNRRWSALNRSRCGSSPWIPTAKPPIQSSPSGLMKSARHMLARPSRFFTCWRRKGSRVQSLPASTSTSSPSRLQRHRPTVALRRHPALGDDLVEHRLRVGEQAARAFADHSDRRGSRDNCRPAPTRGRRASSRSTPSRSLSGHSPKWWSPGYCGARRLARRIVGKGVGARLLERRELAVAAALARLAQLVVIVRGVRDQRLALRVARPATKRRRPRGWRRGRGSPGPA